MLTRTSMNSSLNAGLKHSTAPAREPIPQGSQALSDSGMQINLPPDYEIDYGIITSGACATPEEQAAFDANVAGKPPQ